MVCVPPLRVVKNLGRIGEASAGRERKGRGRLFRPPPPHYARASPAPGSAAARQRTVTLHSEVKAPQYQASPGYRTT